MMDFQLGRKALEHSKRKKKWIILLCLFGVSGYGVYKFYHTPSMVRKRKSLMKPFQALISLAGLVSDSAETIAAVSEDLKEFLQSDSDEIPNSLKQLFKIARSDEISQSLIRVSEAFIAGISRGYASETMNSTKTNIYEQFLDKIFSKAGTGFASVVVGSFARNLVLANADNQLNGTDLSDMPKWESSEKYRGLIRSCIQAFISTAVAVYLDKTMDINTYDEIFAGLTNPNHQNRVRDMLVYICNGAVEILVRTSHQMFTTSETNSDSSLAIFDRFEEGHRNGRDELYEKGGPLGRKLNGGWAGKVSSTLAVPRNRKFVLDVTWRVAFETARSVLQFLSWKLSDGLRKSLNMVHDEVVEIVRYVDAKSSLIFTVCFALYLHILSSSGLLLPV